MRKVGVMYFYSSFILFPVYLSGRKVMVLNKDTYEGGGKETIPYPQKNYLNQICSDVDSN